MLSQLDWSDAHKWTRNTYQTGRFRLKERSRMKDCERYQRPSHSDRVRRLLTFLIGPSVYVLHLEGTGLNLMINLCRLIKIGALNDLQAKKIQLIIHYSAKDSDESSAKALV